jgi:hypothetical protein
MVGFVSVRVRFESVFSYRFFRFLDESADIHRNDDFQALQVILTVLRNYILAMRDTDTH